MTLRPRCDEHTTTAIIRGEWINKPATYVFHGIMSDYSRTVRAYCIGQVRPYAQYERSVSISCKLPRKRNAESHTVTGNAYVEILAPDGTLIYDSRTDIPLDMADWQARRRPCRIYRGGA